MIVKSLEFDCYQTILEIELNTYNKITTLGIFAHANAGKTTLTEQLLNKTHITRTIGRVDQGNTVTDSLQVEKDRGITIRSSYVTFDLGDVHVQLLDTPGHVDFSAEVIRAINVLDVAILVISGVEHVEPQTKTIWNMLVKRKIPTFIFVNKMDRTGADYPRTLDSIHRLLTTKSVSFVDMSTDDPMQRTAASLAQSLADLDDNMLEYYLDHMDDPLSFNNIHPFIHQMIHTCKVYPIWGGSALNDVGLDQFIDFLRDFMPSKPYQTQLSSDQFSAYVYMVRVQNELKAVYMKILSGSIHYRMEIMHNDEKMKVKRITKVNGSTPTICGQAFPHDIVIVHGIDATVGEVVGDNALSQDMFPLTPMLMVNVTPSDGESIGRLRRALAFMQDEDPLLNLRFHDTHFQIDLMGELQGESIVALLKEKYDVHADISAPRMIYRETPTQISSGAASYTWCGHVQLRITPLPRNHGISIQTAITEQDLHKRYMAQVLRILPQFLYHGQYGWKITDILVELTDAQWDSVGSKQMYFNIAAPIALARALSQSEIILLEPVMSYTIQCSQEHCNRILSAVVQFQMMYDDMVNITQDRIEITGQTFLSEIRAFNLQIKKLSNGDATLEYYHAGYEHNPLSDVEHNSLHHPLNPFDTQGILALYGGSSAILR